MIMQRGVIKLEPNRGTLQNGSNYDDGNSGELEPNRVSPRNGSNYDEEKSGELEPNGVSS